MKRFEVERNVPYSSNDVEEGMMLVQVPVGSFILSPGNARHRIYMVVDTEREYQENAKGDPKRNDIIELQLGSTLAAIQYNLDLAREHWYKSAEPYPEAMNYLRKIAALCVQAGEQFGMPQRLI